MNAQKITKDEVINQITSLERKDHNTDGMIHWEEDYDAFIIDGNFTIQGLITLGKLAEKYASAEDN